MSTPYLIGSTNAASGVSATLVLSVATATSANDVIHVSVSSSAVGQAVSGVTDSKGNTYELLSTDTTQISAADYESVGNTVALTTSDTITVTFGGTAGAKCVIAIGMTGVMPRRDVLPSPVVTASSASASISSGTLFEPTEVVIAVTNCGAVASAPTYNSGWATPWTTRQASNQWLSVTYQVVSSSSSVTATATFSSTKSALFMASYIIPGSSFPYLIGEASAASGGSATLAVPVRQAPAAGDTIVVGALATSGSVTGVTDPSSNTYNLVQSETVNTGTQLYTFAAYNVASFSGGGGGGGGTPGKVGCTCTVGLYPSTSTRALAAAAFDAFFLSQYPLAATAFKVYYQQNADGTGKYPTSVGGFNFVDGSNRDITSLVNGGARVWLCYEPNIGTYNSTTGLWTITPAALATEQANFQAAVQYWINNHPQGANGVRVVIYQEPQNGGTTGWPFNNGTSAQNAANYVSIVRNYASGIRALTDPHGVHPKVVYDAAGHASSEWTTYYAGNSYIDEIGVDFYGNTWSSLTHQGTSNLDPLLTLHQLADNNNKPFGVFEMGSAIGTHVTPPSQSLVTDYITYITTLMQGRLQSGLTNSDVMWYAGDANTPNQNTIGTAANGGSNDFRIALLETMWTDISSPASQSTVNVTYSTTSSAQAAFVVGDNNVGPSTDIAVGAAGTGTTASVATGTLSEPKEHIIAFVSNLPAGGQPVMGDSMYCFGSVEAGTSAYLTAAFKVVSTTASDTPSATLTSATWGISVVTDPPVTPTITSVPDAGYVSVPFSQTLTVSGGTAPYTWAYAGTLPPGLSFSTSGVFSGTPTTTGLYSYTVGVTDTNGLIGSLPVLQSITTLSGTGTAPAQALPGNLLSNSDCDSESAVGWTWADYSNANVPTRSTTLSITGLYSTQWTPQSSATSEVSTGFYPVLAGMPYDASCFIWTPAQRQCNVGFAWYDSTQTLIGVVDQGNAYNTVAGSWTPLSYVSVSPGNAAYMKMVVIVGGAMLGDIFNIDLNYVTQTSAQVLIDWNNPTFVVGGSAGQTFMDCTPWTRLDQGISITRGRQDAISEIQPGTATLSLQNDLAQFTRFSSQAIPNVIGGSVNTQRRCQINLADETGQWWTRFDGPISEVDYTFDPVGNTSIAAVTVTDVLAYLNRQDVLFSWTKEQVLAGEPLYHWSLDDSGTVGGAGVAAETSGNNGPPMRLVNSDSSKTAAIAWQDTSGGIETLADAVAPAQPDGSAFWAPGAVQPNNPIRGLASGTVGPYTTPISSVMFTPKQVAQSGPNQFIGGTGFMLEAELSTPITPTATGNDYSFECWFMMDPSIATSLALNYGPYTIMGLGSSRALTNMLCALYIGGGTMSVNLDTYNQPPAFKGLNWSGVAAPSPTASSGTAMSADKVKLPHHMVITMQGSATGAAASLYIDSILAASFTLPAGQTYDTITIGGAYGGCGAWYGNISLVSVYPYVLPQSQITTNCQLGQYGMWETPSDDCVAQLASYADIPAFWSNLFGQHHGLSMAEYIDVTGSNALSGMQQFEQAEHGLLYVDATGALNFHTRDWRMGYPAPDLTLPPDTFDADMQYELIDNFQTNEMGVTGPNTLGATATTILQNQSTGATSLETTSQTLVQASYVNANSQAEYGVYAQSPVSSPLAVPLITWSRAYAALGLPSFSYWQDPNLSDIAAWNANSRSDPWLLPAHLAVDLLTLDPTSGLGISSFYALEIDNMVAPSGTLPTALPNTTASLEWFIEGIAETLTLNARTITFYTSPAEAQRAWVPGDPTYGVLGSTTRIGVSTIDVSMPQADGKDVSHDAGPPYWPPAFSNAMNNPDGSGNAFIGASDMRGLVNNLNNMLNPPMCVVNATNETQSFTNGSLTGTSPPNTAVLFWDTVSVDTQGGMGLIPGYPNWYVVTVPGFYEIDANVTWSLTGSGLSGYVGQAWIIVAQQAAQAIASGVGTPYSVGQYVYPIGEAVRFNSASMTPVVSAHGRYYLGLGDMIGVGAEQNYSSARGTSTAGAGSSLSLQWTGLGQVDDRRETNSALGNGGTVIQGSHGPLQQATFTNIHTFAYQGAKGFAPLARRNQDNNVFQGLNGKGNDEGSQASQIQFNNTTINSTLTGHTLLSAELTATNISSWYSTGCKLMLGTTTVGPDNTTFNASGHNSNCNIMHQSFTQGQTLSFAIPVSMVSGLVSGVTTALIVGDSNTTDLNYYGSFVGGPASWTLVVNYV